MFYKMINDRAEKNYVGPELTTDNYEEFWFPVWFGAAEEIYQECLDEGLTGTAIFVKNIIEEQKKLSNYKGT